MTVERERSVEEQARDYKSGDYMVSIFSSLNRELLFAVLKLHLGISVGDTVKTYEHSYKKNGVRFAVNPYNPDHVEEVTFHEDKIVCHGWTGDPKFKRKATLRFQDITQCVFNIENGVLTLNSVTGANRHLWYWKLTFKRQTND